MAISLGMTTLIAGKAENRASVSIRDSAISYT